MTLSGRHAVSIPGSHDLDSIRPIQRVFTHVHIEIVDHVLAINAGGSDDERRHSSATAKVFDAIQQVAVILRSCRCLGFEYVPSTSGLGSDSAPEVTVLCCLTCPVTLFLPLTLVIAWRINVRKEAECEEHCGVHGHYQRNRRVPMRQHAQGFANWCRRCFD